MRTEFVYLAGPMSGLTYEDALAWRVEATEALRRISASASSVHYHTLDPCRGKEYLTGSVLAGVDTKDQGWGDIIVPRDKYDVLRSAIVLVNLLPGEKVGKVSIGTMFEIAWAADHGRYTIVVMRHGDPVHDHEFVRKNASIVVPNLDAAYECIKGLNP